VFAVARALTSGSVDFQFSADQDALRDSVKAFLASEATSSYVRAMADDERGFTDELWAKIADLGWPGLLVPEEHGGLGLGLVDMVVVLEEMGRLPLPGPFFSSAVLATLAARGLDEGNLLRQLASGELRGTVALEESGHGDPVDRVRTRARRKGADWVITGLKPLVLDGHTADWAIVVARTDQGLGSFLVDGLSDAQPVPTLDPTRKAARLEMHERRAVPIGPLGDHTSIWRRVADDAAVALAAELVGACEQSLDEAVEYAKVRVQFDRPLASFQAIRHKAVDMLHKLELARVGTHYAAWTSDVDEPEREKAAAMCKGFVGEAAVSITGEDIQIHGGVGFTWDCDAHFFYKRAKQNDVMLGYQGHQRQRLADLVLDSA
jgi:alkylation response protein AidB-like acyl-CoA dehydrogenase